MIDSELIVGRKFLFVVLSKQLTNTGQVQLIRIV